MIKIINKENFEVFLELFGEVECGSKYNHNNKNHKTWISKAAEVMYARESKVFGIFENDIPIGFITLHIDERLDNIKHKAEILDLGIFESYRGKGFGSKLINHIIEYCRKENLFVLYVATYAGDKQAIKFYLKNNFIPEATLSDLNGPNDEGQIYLRMRLNENIIHNYRNSIISFFFKDKKKTAKALKIAYKKIKKILPAFIMMLIFVSITLFLIPEKTIALLLDNENISLSLAIASILGSVTLMPGFIVFPLSGILLQKGVTYLVISAFTTTMMMVGVVTFPVEKIYLGTKVTIIRNLVSFLIAMIVAVVTGLFFNELRFV